MTDFRQSMSQLRERMDTLETDFHGSESREDRFSRLEAIMKNKIGKCFEKLVDFEEGIKTIKQKFESIESLEKRMEAKFHSS